MTLLVAIPRLDRGADASGPGLDLILETVRAATDADIHVFFPPGWRGEPPAGATVHTDPLPDEPDSPFPVGWLGAVRALADKRPGASVLVLDPDSPHLRPELVTRAADVLSGGLFQAVATMAPSQDHPCQWEEFFDVLSSRAYVPVDARTGDQAERTGELLAHALGVSGPARVGLPMVMPPVAPWPRGDFSGRVLEWLPEKGVLLGNAPRAAETDRALGERVFLVLQDDGRVRQAAFCGLDLAALPLFCPVGRAEAVFLRGSGVWEAFVSDHIRGACRYQLFGLPNRDAPRGEGDPGRLLPVRSGESARVEGQRRFLAGRVAPLSSSTLAVFTVLAEARLPGADISVPFETPRGGWRRDDWVMATRNTGTGELILGRQSFPHVYEPEGSLLGLCGAALEDPAGFLAGRGEVFSLMIAEGRTRATGRPPSGPAGRAERGEKPERALEASFEQPGLQEFFDRYEALGLALDQARLALDRAEASPTGPESTGVASGRGEPDESDLVRAVRLLADVAERQGTLTLEDAAVAEAVSAYDGRTFGLLPLRIHRFHQSRSLRRSETLLDEEARQKLGEDLLGLWVRSRGGDVARGYEALSARALALGLSPVWSAGVAMSLARRGLLDQTLELVRSRYASSPWLRDEHSRIAVTCLRPAFVFDQYLKWMERDAAPGRMSVLWIAHLCEALAVCRREDEAQAVADAACARHPDLYNLHAISSLWRFQTRNFDPVRALPGFEKDASEDRLTGIFVLLRAAALSASGRQDEAAEAVRRAYAKDSVAANGYAMVGWYGCFLGRRDADAALAWFDKDLDLGRFDDAWRGYLAALLAYKGEMDEALAMVDGLYARSSGHMGLTAQLGLMRWLADRDLDRTLQAFRRDFDLGRLGNVHFRLLYWALLDKPGACDRGLADTLLEGVPRTTMTWDLGVARLGLFGFSPEESAELMNARLRERFLAESQARQVEGGEPEGGAT